MTSIATDFDPCARMRQNPRNIWSKLLSVLHYGGKGDYYAAKALLQSAKYAKEMNPEVFAVFARQVEALKNTPAPLPKMNIPEDATRDSGFMAPLSFHRLSADRYIPAPYPVDMALPDYGAPQNNHSFIAAAAALVPHTKMQHTCFHIIFSPKGMDDLERLVAGLKVQGFVGKIKLTVLIDSDWAAFTAPKGLWCEVLTGNIYTEMVQQRLSEIADQADIVAFMQGSVTLDEAALQRAAHLALVSDTLVQPLAQMAPAQNFETPFTTKSAAKPFGGRYPFRDMSGMNFIVSGKLLKRIGLPNPRFSGLFQGAREWAFRCYNRGCYFAPLLLPEVANFKEARSPKGDLALYTNLCPNHWDRKQDRQYEHPKVSIYIPAYNASKYLERAIDSVLDQDYRDLEVCISDDGSKDKTLELLEGKYRDDPRVRWVANPNGGISFASNQAIAMSRGIYVGQLDSDDCLKPGAVRRLMQYLDENPDVVCCYGSCERINAAGEYIGDEYSWQHFGREKMMITSIAHHFRMFRRAAWERTTKFREDIVNAVDYDIFLKMSEVGRFHHIDERLYQRRWHGENTSIVNEGFQTTNAYRVQTETLERLGMGRFWEVYVPDPAEPRRVTYRRKAKKMVIFWPNYSRANPYQRLLYQKAGQNVEFCAGDIDAALRAVEKSAQPEQLIFHLHWLNFIFIGIEDATVARKAVDGFLNKLYRFRKQGGRIVWTVHNTVSHDTLFHDLEVELSNKVIEFADKVHFHSASSVPEVSDLFAIPAEKLTISRHGNYLGAYPDFVSKAAARRYLGIDAGADVILFTGQVRPYKGAEDLVAAFRKIWATRPNALPLIAGSIKYDILDTAEPPLSTDERARILTANRFLDDMEMQLFFRAADVVCYPYRKVLTSGSLLLALSFGLPVVVPEVGMTRETLEKTDAGQLYDPNDETALQQALQKVLERKDKGTIGAMGQAAVTLAAALDWPDVEETIYGA